VNARLSIVGISELALIAALAGSGTYAFINSSIYVGIKRLMEAINFPVSYLPIMLWGLLSLYGVINIIVRVQSSGRFIFLIFLLSLPSILSHNILNWPGIIGVEFTLSTSLGFYEVLALGVFIITGYVVLNRIHLIRHTERSLTARGADPVEVKNAAFHSHLTLILCIVVASGVTAAIAFVARSLELLTLGHLRHMPWNVLVVGIGCILLLSGYLYWLAVRRRTKNKSSS
jgi:hypothetical protein